MKQSAADLRATTPIDNLLPIHEFTPQYMALCELLGPRPRDIVAIHKQKLGRQSRTFIGSERRRFFVWDRSQWTVYVHNIKGVCFEVPVGATADEARVAWREYVNTMVSDADAYERSIARWSKS